LLGDAVRNKRAVPFFILAGAVEFFQCWEL